MILWLHYKGRLKNAEKCKHIGDNIEGTLSDISIGFSFLFSFEWPEWLRGIPKL